MAAWGGDLTMRQREILAYLWVFYRENDQLPPMERLARAFNFRSTNGAQAHVDALARRGRLERNSVGKWKFTALAREEMRKAETLHPALSE